MCCGQRTHGTITPMTEKFPSSSAENSSFNAEAQTIEMMNALQRRITHLSHKAGERMLLPEEAAELANAQQELGALIADNPSLVREIPEQEE